MKQRQPYRSPFWTPDVSREVSGSSVWDTAFTPVHPPVTPMPEPPIRPAASPQRRIERGTPDRAKAYADSDLALFGRLMDFSNRGQAGRPAQEPSSPHPQGREEPVRRRDVSARSDTRKDYTSRDLALFQKLQPASSGRQPTHEAPRRSPSPQPSAPAHGYSKADLDAFDKLARFGRSG